MSLCFQFSKSNRRTISNKMVKAKEGLEKRDGDQSQGHLYIHIKLNLNVTCVKYTPSSGSLA